MATFDSIVFVVCAISFVVFFLGYLACLVYSLSQRRGNEITDAFFRAAFVWTIPGKYQLAMAVANFVIAYAMYRYGMPRSGLFFMVMSPWFVMFHSVQPWVVRMARRRYLLPYELEG